MSVLRINNSICRVCTRKQLDTIAIFSTETFSEKPQVISEVITSCASVQVHRDDGLPENICSECLGGLQQAYNFRRLCEKSDCELRNELCGNRDIKTEDDVSIDELEFVNTGYEANIKDEEVNLDLQVEDRTKKPVNLEFKAGQHQVNVEKILVEGNKCGTEQAVNNIGVNVIKTEESKDENTEESEFDKQDSEDLIQDDRKLHPELETASYKCDSCDKIYTSKYNPKKHTRIHTGENLYTKEETVLNT